MNTTQIKNAVSEAKDKLAELEARLEESERKDQEAEASNKKRIVRGELVFAEDFARVGYRATYVNLVASVTDDQWYLVLIKDDPHDFISLTEPVPTPDNQPGITRGQLRNAKPHLKLTFEE